MHRLKHFIKHFLSATRKGHNVHSPFAYQLCEEVFYNKASFYDFEKLDEVRKQLRRNATLLKIEDFGAGSKTFTGNERKVGDIASRGISTKRQSELLYKLVNFLRPATIVELGTSLGLTTLYLAKANAAGKVISIEGSSELHSFASALIKENHAENVTVVAGKFDEQLPGILKDIPSLDLLYVDGNHSYEATLKYFHMALEKKNNDSVFVFDDIYWSEGMARAWEEIRTHPAVTMDIDAFYMGFIFFKNEIKEKVSLKVWL